jgi:hypothetical protein
MRVPADPGERHSSPEKLAGAHGADRQRRVRVALAVLVCSALVLANHPPAAALAADGNGNYTQILCANPASGEGLGLSAMPEGLSNPASAVTWQITSSSVQCPAGPLRADDGIRLAVGLTAGYPQGTWSALLYQAPANVTINGGTIYRAERAEGPDNGFMGIDQQGGDYSSLYSLPRNDQDSGDWFAGNIAQRGTFAAPFSPGNGENLTISPEAGHWDVNATCDPNGNDNGTCPLAAGQWEYRLFAGVISLHADQDPQASNITGSLVSDPVLRASESISFSASDAGPGLAYIRFLLDGTTVRSQLLDPNSGHCVPIPGTDAYTWAYQVPCKTSLGGRTYSLDTTALANGPHRIQVLIEDAAGNSSIVLDRSVEIGNSPSGAAWASQPLLQPAIAGPANGVPASEGARLHLDGATVLTRRYSRSALTLRGSLADATGRPIAGAQLDVLESSSAGVRVIGHATSTTQGNFTAHVPSGASRALLVAYRAFASDIAYAAQASLSESVLAGVRLWVTPRQTGATGTIILSGRVLGRVPRSGVLVELLVRYQGSWEPFRDPRTDATGRFRVRYRFQGAVGRFPFRARVPGGQAAYPYADGQSTPVAVLSG